MFGYTRRGSETRPSVCSSVTLPASPAPSTSNDSGVGYHNGRLQWLQVDLSKTLLSKSEKRKLQGFLHKHGDVFVQPGGQLGKTHVATHNIPLRNGAQPVHKLPYRQSPQMRQEMDKIIQNHLRQGIIEPTTSGEWASRAFLFKKQGGGYRMVANYRDRNAQTITQFLGVSHVDETLDEVGAKNPTIFSCLDLEQGFHQVPIAEEDRDKTAFLTYSGKFRYTTMPMGLKNAPKSFQSMMDFILSGVKYKNCLCFIDDKVVFSPTFEQHLLDLEE